MLKDSGRCFACGKENPQGLRLNVRKTTSGVEVDCVLPEHFAGWQGIAHGGIVATILDELLAWACTNTGRNCVTAEMTVRYRKPVKTGSPLRGFGRVTGEKGRLIYAEARLLDEAGVLAAEATGKMMQVSDASVQ
ncbi:MAG TPA: PaaI family thioesterase [bacterium]|nr:PaaI family thioesterase [bacterium]